MIFIEKVGLKLRSAFSPKKWPALNRKPTKKMTPRIMGKIARIVSEISFTEFSIPPICAQADPVKKSNKSETYIAFFISNKIFVILEIDKVKLWYSALYYAKRQESVNNILFAIHCCNMVLNHLKINDRFENCCW